jgi:hypothetical protein
MFELACLLLTSVFVPQDAAPERTIEQEIEDVIARANALRSFRAEYRVHGTKDDEITQGTIVIAYDASGRGEVHGDFGDSRVDTWLTSESFVFRTEDESGTSWKRATLPRLGTQDVLDRRFPPKAGGLGPGVCFDFRSPGAGASDETMLQTHLHWSPTGRSVVLHGLDDLRSKSSQVEREGDVLRWSDEDTSWHWSRVTGFLQRFEYRGTAEDSCVLDLLEVEVNEFASSELDLPDEATSAVEDEELSRALADGLLLHVRRAAFRRVTSRLGSGKLDWNDRTRADWRAVLDALHRERLPRLYSDWQTDLEDWIDAEAERVRSIVLRAPTDEEFIRLRDEINQARERLVLDFAETQETYLERLPGDTAATETSDALLEIERDVVDEVFREIVSTPVLSELDEQMRAAFDS